MRRNNPEQSVAYLRRTFTTNGKPNTTSSPLDYKILVEYSYDYNFKTSSITSTDTFYGIQYISNH